jgi:DNA adenine methylase
MIEEAEISFNNWQTQRNIQKNKENTQLLELGFSTIFLNRTNISGIIMGGVIGGKEQKGNYKMDCRFNKEQIINRIKKVAAYKAQK